jgi:hypothetical protein
MQTTAIIEMDAERDRKICVSLDLKVIGADRELAQWLLDHPRYSAPVVAGWLGCSETRIKQLRGWANKGFVGPQRDGNLSQPRNDNRRRDVDAPLNPQENPDPSQDDDTSYVADPEVIKENLMDTLGQHSAVAGAFIKILKQSSLAEGATGEMNSAINRLITRWRSVQAILTKEGRHGPS